MLLRPRRLSPGDTIGVVAPASAPPNPATIDRGVASLEALGFKIKLGPNVRKRHGFLAGNDRERAADLMKMFTDRRVRAIVCVRGGYGAARLLPRLDYGIIRENAKIFVGYSDITSLHCAFRARAGLISFHGPMLNSEFIHPTLPRFTRDSFLRTLTQATGPGSGFPRDVAQGYRGKKVKIIRRGIARGELVGGNLSVLCTLVGTLWQPALKGRILFLEDVGEPPYRFDRMLTHLLNCGWLRQVAGIAIGLNADCDDPKAKATREYRQTLDEVLKERLLPLKIPIISGLPFGHVAHNATLPIGGHVVLDADRGVLSLAKPAVS